MGDAAAALAATGRQAAELSALAIAARPAFLLSPHIARHCSPAVLQQDCRKATPMPPPLLYQRLCGVLVSSVHVARAGNQGMHRS